jgi:hypothetical protein
MGKPTASAVSHTEFIGVWKRTQGTETSQYLEERKSNETPLVVASERGPAQWLECNNRNSLERLATWVIAPYG